MTSVEEDDKIYTIDEVSKLLFDQYKSIISLSKIKKYVLANIAQSGAKKS